MREYPDHPLVGVGVVVFQAGKVLMVRRAKAPRQEEWSLPGGLQKLGESVYEAGRREVMEETGVTIRVLGVVDVVDLIETDTVGAGVCYHFTLIDLVASWIHGEPRAGDDAAEVAWMELGVLPQLGLWPETERVINLAHRRWLAEDIPKERLSDVR